jgi:hypothetical protein
MSSVPCNILRGALNGLCKHRHSGIGYHTPESVHYGPAAGIREQRAAVLEAAYAARPERFIAPSHSLQHWRRLCGSMHQRRR